MAFMTSKAAQQPFSQTDKLKLKHSEDEDDQEITISSQLHLKPSSHSMDKNVILKRIRHRKSLNKVKTAFQALVTRNLDQEATVLANQRKWLQDPQDAFSSP